MAAREVICHTCGAKNEETAPRCLQCGARLEEVRPDYTPEEEEARRFQQEGFALKWALIGFVVYTIIQGVALVIAPKIIPGYDPQGWGGLAVSLIVWLSGGFLIGVISPGRTFAEPAVAALVAAVPTIMYLMWTTPEGLGPGILEYIVAGILGVMLSLFGAFMGEKLQVMMKGGSRRQT
ncbi:MAG: zinc ribbon domain-containing protein [Deltaproteobacteria bacterium]|nr:zinc ribbon domain-containing protein [Deltaproteobacteria bacterium]